MKHTVVLDKVMRQEEPSLIKVCFANTPPFPLAFKLKIYKDFVGQ